MVRFNHLLHDASLSLMDDNVYRVPQTFVERLEDICHHSVFTAVFHQILRHLLTLDIIRIVTTARSHDNPVLIARATIEGCVKVRVEVVLMGDGET